MSSRPAPVTARAVISPGRGQPAVVGEVQVPWPTGDRVLVDVEAVGGCHADLGAHEGSFPVAAPIVLGHEGTGRVRAVGPDVKTLEPGDRVVLTYHHCGRCPRCRAGQPTQCLQYAESNFPARGDAALLGPDGTVNAGFFGQSSFATVALAHARNAVRVSTALPPEVLAPLGCGVQTGVGAITDVADVRADQSVVIIGLGGVGLAAAHAARSRGVRAVVAVDVSDARLEDAQRMGVLATVDARSPGWVQAVTRVLGGGADVAVECSGARGSLPAAIRCVRHGGLVVVAGVPAFEHREEVDVADLVNRSISVLGTAEGGGTAHHRVPELVRMVEDGSLPVGDWIDVRPFSDVPAWCDGRLSVGVKPVFVV